MNFRKTRNDGKDFENEFKKVANQYRYNGVLNLEKCDPPTRIVRGQIIYQPNPFLDWVGTWTERGGRALFIETKSTEYPRLPMGDNGKLSWAQIQSLIGWHFSGAAVGVCWQFIGAGVAFIPVGKVKDVWDSGRRHIRWDECEVLPQGNGFILFDFVTALRRWYPAASATHT